MGRGCRDRCKIALMLPATSLPPNVEKALAGFMEAARDTFGDRLRSIVLFGSAAEGRLRTTSDVNVIVVLTEFIPEQAKTFAPAAALARAAVRLRPMFLLTTEISAAAICFAPKFADILRRHQVLYGPDPFQDVQIPPSAKIARLREVLLNLTLRLRTGFAERAGHEEQIATMTADAIGPIRTSAATVIELETGSVLSPKEALRQIADSAPESSWRAGLAIVSEIRERKPLSGAPSEALWAIVDIVEHLRRRVELLNERI